jgi:hypothetical protein
MELILTTSRTISQTTEITIHARTFLLISLETHPLSKNRVRSNQALEKKRPARLPLEEQFAAYLKHAWLADFSQDFLSPARSRAALRTCGTMPRKFYATRHTFISDALSKTLWTLHMDAT